VNNITELKLQEQYKICPRCKIDLPFSAYHKSKNKKFGLQVICKNCKSKELKKYALKRAEYSMKYRYALPIKEYLLANAKRSALKRKMECDLTLDNMPIIPTTCPILGTDLSVRIKDHRNLYSIDRIDNNKGYVQDNIVIVSMRVNNSKANLSFNELEKMYFFYKQFQKPE